MKSSSETARCGACGTDVPVNAIAVYIDDCDGWGDFEDVNYVAGFRGGDSTLLECGHVAEPFAGFGRQDFGAGSVSVRECERCAREKGEGYRWQPVVVRSSEVRD